MVKPLELPEHAPEAAKLKAARYALGLTDVARILGVSKQTAYEWAREGRLNKRGFRTAIPSLRAPSTSKLEPLRFTVEDILAYAEQHELTADITRLPLDLQRRLQVGVYAPGQVLSVVAEPEWISEVRAAAQLGMSRTGLRQQRIAGKLNPALGVSGSKYSQLDIHRVLDGTLELYLGELPPGPPVPPPAPPGTPVG